MDGDDRLKAELLDRGLQRQVENELLYELRGLEKRIRLPGALAQVLVQVAKEPRVEVRADESMDDRPLLILPAPELQ